MNPVLKHLPPSRRLVETLHEQVNQCRKQGDESPLAEGVGDGEGSDGERESSAPLR